MATEPYINVDNLWVRFDNTDVVKGISFAVNQSETLALVGESGSGKSVTALSILQLLAENASYPQGSITVDREEVINAPPAFLQHLRGGKVARGGLRWSDRREDFRTEVLGLMKAQMVKNSVIVPVGSKGGFVVKSPPAGDRNALMDEVVYVLGDHGPGRATTRAAPGA